MGDEVHRGSAREEELDRQCTMTGEGKAPNSCIWTPPALAEAILTDPPIGTIAVVYPALQLEELPPGHDDSRALAAN